MFETNDITSIVMDEIALEGLDGITTEGLFVRLKGRPEFSCSLNNAYKQFIWDMTCRMNDINMYELPEPRKALVIFNRYDFVDPELGIVLEPEIIPEEIYPHAPVDDKVLGNRGSCANYDKRIRVYDVASTMTLQEVDERWGTKLVLVASQNMRNMALMGPSVDPELELTIIQYCIIERIGRSRHLGEVTQGRVSLQITGEDPKALFYHRKFLLKHGLIVKQIHHQKSGNQNCSGSLLHLPRFYVERWPKVLFLTKRVIEILRGCKNCIADYDEIKKKLGLTNSLKKLFQTSYFQRFVRTDLRLPYRHLYPDAKENEWRSMNSMKEKMIRVIQLLDPNADVDAVSAREDEFEDDDEHGDGSSSQEFCVAIDRSFLSQAYKCVEGAGVNGYSQMELVQKMGLPKLSARTVSRNLLKRGVASTFMNDVGRQRVSRFRARKWDQQCTRIQNIERDIQHMRAELLSKALGAGHEVSHSPNIPSEEHNTSNKKKRHADISVDELKSSVETRRGVKRSPESLDDGSLTKMQRSESTETEDVMDNIYKNNGSEVKSLHDEGPLSTSDIKDQASTSEALPMYRGTFQTKEAMRKFFMHHSKDGPVMTYRIFKRINMILEFVKIHKVVDDHSKFLKLINEEEDREGLKMKIDKKSLLRLLIRLKEEGHLKLHTYILTDGVKVKTMVFICDKNVPLDHPAIVSAIEQAKMKLFIVNRESINVSLAGPPSESTIPCKKHHSNKKQKMTFVYDKTVGRQYGFCPKFLRMRTLHQFLFYLVYGYEGDIKINQELVVPYLESKDIIVDDSLQSELTQVYKLELSWKMFIPPLPPYSGWPEGWSIMCDILLRLPLSIFVSVFNVCYVVPGLNEYLQHPIRKHFLVRQLPVPMRNGLMAFRKYIFSIHEVVQRLCFIGLLQFGPQRLKEKDQVLIYMNRRTSLLDTVSSKPGYHQVSEGEYPEIKYEFQNMANVETYWYNLWNICLNTQLGGRMCVQGKDIVLEQLATKPQMQAALQPVRPSRAPALDNGVVPGDRRGAAGLDSAIFAHLKRNWNWANVSAKSGEGPKKVDRRKVRLMNLKAAPVIFTKSAIIVKRSINYLHNGRFSAVRAERRPHSIPPGAEVLPKKGHKGKRNVVRRIEVRKSQSSNKPYYDEVDLKALQLMSKLRVDWSSEEDTLLLLCKVASMYLCPNPRQQTIAFSEIRDILHFHIPEAQNKTSKACQRRILYMIKNLATSNNLAMNLEELKQDEDICERFGRPEDNARENRESIKDYEVRIHEKFRLLVNELQGRSDRMVTASGSYCTTIPENAVDFWDLFDVVEPKTVIKSKGVFQDVKNVVDIHCSVVNTIIHSSLCSTTDKTSWAYQLFRVYQQYPDSLLRATMAKLRQDQMVSLKKSYARHKQKVNYLPLSSSPYQLSISYLQLIQTKYQYGVYQEAYSKMKDISHWVKESKGEPRLLVPSVTGGAAACLVEALCKRTIFLSVEIPEQVIILDPWISEKDETYTRIVQRYKDILQTYRSGQELTTSALFRSTTGDPSLTQDNETQENDDDIISDDKCEEHQDPVTQNSKSENVRDYISQRGLQITENENKLSCDEDNSDQSTKLSEVAKEAQLDLSQTAMEIDAIPSLVQEKFIGNDKEGKTSLSTTSQGTESLTVTTAATHTSLENNLPENLNTSTPSLAWKDTELNFHSSQSTSSSMTKELTPTSTNTDYSRGDKDSDQLSKDFPEEDHSLRQGAIPGNENTSINKVDKIQPKRWARLDFEWISEKEWSAGADIPEQAVDESEEPEGTEEERIHSNYIDIVGESEEGDNTSQNNQQTLVARAASRIALFMMREEMDDDNTNQVASKQHAHDFFVVNSCSVFCELPSKANSSKNCTDDCDVNPENTVTPLTERRINEILEVIKSEAIVDLKVPSEEEVFSCAPSDYWFSMKDLLHFIEMKKYLGATLQQIQMFYETLEGKKFDLATVLSLFMQQKILMRTGIAVPRYVHKKHIWPWLAHTFKFVRLDREKVTPIDSRVISCSEDAEYNIMDIEETLNSVNKEDTVSPSDQLSELGDCENSLISLKKQADNVQENDVKHDAPSIVNTFVTLPEMGSPIVREGREGVEQLNTSEKTLETDGHGKEEVNCGVESLGKRPHSSKSTTVTDPQSFGTVVASKDMRKAAQNLAFSEKEEIHVFIRPWIRINGTLNRRVLDRLLGSVLGHAMYQPGQTLHTFGLRFQPAVQPVHTRELIEILHSLGCLKLLVRKQKHKVTLFSKPQPVILVDADGTEDENEIILEPEADAISRLAQFIGEKSYSQDFMAVQEQIFSGRGPRGETSRRRKKNFHDEFDTDISNSSDQCIDDLEKT